MRLLTIANRYYFYTLLVVFVIGSLLAYNVLKSIINKEFNEKLFAEQEQLVFELKNYETLEKNYYLNIGDVIELNEVADNPNIEPFLRDTIMYDPYEKKELAFRQLTFSTEIKTKYYVITISKSLLPNQDLIEGISEIMLGIALALALALGLLNRVIFFKLWGPFHEIIEQLKLFKITHPEPLNFHQTDVEEFNQLNNVLDKMISKSIHDYKMLKDYTENTSHEIQTPLAIIKNKAEILLQENLPEKQLAEIGKIYEAAGRLARLKEGLSTLTKIENNQFIESEEIPLGSFIQSRIEGFKELIEMKGISLRTKITANPTLQLNNDLAYMLITNLLSNAIKHNLHNGRLEVELNKTQLIISNTGNPPLVPTEQLFDRFIKSGNNHESTGLGLSLVKKIVERYGMEISYVFDPPHHIITLDFKPKA